ncbi:hypothetical protein ECG_09751 [Echinococcus granulosus]|nr:hypothetical protein ECG_09751 [Echinococcus granulosus]
MSFASPLIECMTDRLISPLSLSHNVILNSPRLNIFHARVYKMTIMMVMSNTKISLSLIRLKMWKSLLLSPLFFCLCFYFVGLFAHLISCLGCPCSEPSASPVLLFDRSPPHFFSPTLPPPPLLPQVKCFVQKSDQRAYFIFTLISFFFGR